MIFVKNSRGGGEVNMINTLSKKNLVKNRVGGREVNHNLDNDQKYPVWFFWTLPLSAMYKCIFPAGTWMRNWLFCYLP